MGCDCTQPRDQISVGPLPVWSAKSDADAAAVFHPFTTPLRAFPLRRVRPAIEMTQDSGGIRIRAAYQTSDDGVVWSAANVISQIPLISNGTALGGTPVDIASVTTAKQFIRFGVLAQNETSGSSV